MVFIKDVYQGYGYLRHKEDGKPKYDMYELLAFWNIEQLHANEEEVHYTDELNYMKEIDEHTNFNRGLGGDLGCADNDMRELKYPLKLVSCTYTGTYESLDSMSCSCPVQGSYALKRSSNEYIKRKTFLRDKLVINLK